MNTKTISGFVIDPKFLGQLEALFYFLERAEIQDFAVKEVLSVVKNAYKTNPPVFVFNVPSISTESAAHFEE